MMFVCWVPAGCWQCVGWVNVECRLGVGSVYAGFGAGSSFGVGWGGKGNSLDVVWV